MPVIADVLVAFGGGMLSFLSPCVLPLVPGYLSLMSGIGTGDASGAVATATRAGTRRLLGSTVLFVIGFTVVFTALFASASAISDAVFEHKEGIQRVAGALVVVMGLFLAGAVSPPVLLQERRFHISPSRLGSWAPPVMGMAFAFGWTPCIGPILASVIAAASTRESLGRGVVLLVSYSLGLGVPFVASAVAFDKLAGLFDWFKRHGRTINLVAGLLLAAFGLLLFFDRVTLLSNWIQDLMDRIGLDRLARI